ncbi:MAG: hypothetical protein ACI9TF_001464, partial [Paracrocinitomix sp.]
VHTKRVQRFADYSSDTGVRRAIRSHVSAQSHR